ncbi:MAG: 3D domain-containing protein [Parcubacteria group bacterium GW2011_GWA1_50_14]|nr:MAG: 3D domain-containing protein [Parcubacteria group bacterium GW2011_GWA1_50_14]
MTIPVRALYYPSKEYAPGGGRFLLENNMGTYIIFLAALVSGLYPSSATAVQTTGDIELFARKTTTIERVVVLPDQIAEKRTVWVTAYSSTPEETDDTPYITASGTRVRDGIIATNLLPFNTKVKIPKLFGDKIFVVEDRMHERKTENVDVWMATKGAALKFGIARAEIVVLEE